MKNVLLAVALTLAGSVAFAGSCPCEKAEAVVTKTVTVTREVVARPVVAVRGLRARVAARRAARLEARAARAECVAAACAAACGCEAAPAE